MENPLALVIICAAVALTFNLLLKKLQIETVIGYILTGIVVGSSFTIDDSHSLELIAEFGIVFLMFTIGLEFSPQKLKLMRKEVFIFGPLQVLASAAIFFALGHWVFGLPEKTNLIISLSLSLSSTAIVLNLLNRSRKITRTYGRNSIGILLFQDLAVIPILLMVSIFSNQDASLGTMLTDLAIGVGVIFILVFVGARMLTPHILHHVIGSRSNEIFVGSILLFVIGIAYIAHHFGLSYSLGAFLAGMIISETHYKHQVEADLTPFRDLLLGVFFISVGLQVDLHFVVNNIGSIIIVMLLLLTVKATVLFALMRVFQGTPPSLKTALLLAQCGEFSFVVFETAQRNSLFMNEAMGQTLIMAIVLTMMMTPFIFRGLDQITNWILRSSDSEIEGNVQNMPVVDDEQIIICGFGHYGQRVAKHLEATETQYLGIEYDLHSFREAEQQGLPVIYGNSTQRQLLEAAHIEQAKAVVIAMTNEQRILLTAQTIRLVAPHTPIIVCVGNQRLKDELASIGVDLPIDSLEEAALALAAAVSQME